MSALFHLDFDEPTHTYSYKGLPVPSVTQILEPYSGLEFVDQATLDATAEFGNNVHLACELYDLGELDRESLDPRIEEYLQGWIKFLEDSEAVVLYCEHQVYSPIMRVAGTIDRIMSWKRTKGNVILDIKSGATVTKTVGPQTAGYAELWKDMTGQKVMPRYCVHLKPKDYNLIRLNDPNDINIFRAALTIHRWQK